MDVFKLREQLTQDYANYASSFINIRDQHLHNYVQDSLSKGVFWPQPLIQLNPSFESGGMVKELVDTGILHDECSRIFRKNKAHGMGEELRFHSHQSEAIEIARRGENYILTTGTGSGKSLSYIVPIVDHVLRRGSGKGIQAIIVYPMNALANSQAGELEKFLQHGYSEGTSPVTFARYTGQENETERQQIITHPPDIILTNYVMLELIMTRPRERQLIERAKGLRFLVLDELHTYRGRQGADVGLLVRRVRNRLETSEQELIFVGTSATLASEGTYEEQQEQVAEVGTQIFGSPVKPHNIIGETLRRSTSTGLYTDQQAYEQALINTVRDYDNLQIPTTYDGFISHPLSIWIEDTFGLKEVNGRLTRQQPRSIQDAATELSNVTDMEEEICKQIIQHWLLAGYACEPNPETGFVPFAFRLHQFISPGDTVYSTIELENTRYITLNGQQFVPGDRNRVLYPLCFCRECGQEYYTIRLHRDDEHGYAVVPRDFNDRASDNDSDAGYLYIGSHNPWPDDIENIINDERLPDEWLEEKNGVRKIRSYRKKQLPKQLYLSPCGDEDQEGLECVYISTPFIFCLNCGVGYGPRQSDYGKLSTLNSEGRSSATTLLSLSAIRSLKVSDLDQHAQKLLSFTDNRQDASLQAGHFNDFIEVSLLRGAIYRAANEAGADGLSHEIVAEKVFDALNLPIHLYASDPDVRFQALQDTHQALRQVLGYRIYRDLRRGWRIALPNLEQCGLLEIDYVSLDEVCRAEDVWQDFHPALANATPDMRIKVSKVLLDYMRRELAIKVDYLTKNYQDRIQQRSSQRLEEPWAIDEDERMEYASILLPRPSSPGDDGRGNYTYVSSRGGFGIYLRRPGNLTDYENKLKLDETQQIIQELLEGLRVAGLVEIVLESPDDHDVPGYQLVASSMRWRAGDGQYSFRDPIRIPKQSQEGGRPNPFQR